MAISKRDLRDIQTLSVKVNQAYLSDWTDMKLICLDKKKARQGKESGSMSKRIADIDALIREIKAQNAALLEALGEPARTAARATDRQNSGNPRPIRLPPRLYPYLQALGEVARTVER